MTPTQNLSPLPAFMQYEQLNAGNGIVLKQFRQRETVHAYLLTGARGLGKRTFAKVLASALFCVSEKKPCGECSECKRFFDGNHTDVITVFADDGKQIGVDRIREVIKTISQHAFSNAYRVVMIEPVEKMTQQAQNCLLKSLEEPISNVIFLLMTHELTATLGTIASRCMRVKMTPWPDEILLETLQALGFSQANAAVILPRCGGNIGTAIEMLSDSTQDAEVKAFLKDALRMTNDASAVSLSTRLKENKEGAEQAMNALEQAVYQALLVCAGRLDAAALKDYPPNWQAAAQKAPISDFNHLLDAVFQTRKLKAGQVNWQSNIDHLMIRLLEEETKWQQL
ncbi:MAG: AAA family ATPase [Clostridia bacterium]